MSSYMATRRVSATSLSPGAGRLGPSSYAAGNRRRSSTRLDHFLSSSIAHNKPNNMWSNKVGQSVGLLPGRTLIGPLILCGFSPIFAIVLYHVLVHCDGSVLEFWNEARGRGLVRELYNIWPTWKNVFVWKLIISFMTIQLLIMKLVPGKVYRGPISPAGNIPVYNANGFQAFLITFALFNIGVLTKFFNGAILYDNIGEIISSMNIFALLLCFGLYFKGLYYPSSSDHGSTGNRIYDFYWGTELYPRIFGWDVKQFTNCRCGMTFWALFVVSCAYKQHETYGHVSNGTLVNVTLQLIYIAKFFWWEDGYLASIDIAHDRAGFYICWGVLVFVPSVYTSHTMFLTEHPDSIPSLVAGCILIVGIAAIWINYDCDRQRHHFRSTHGMCKIWGADPYFIEAKYKTESGDIKTSLLLACGWWGISRHFNYIPELVAAACWTIPVSSTVWLPYVYVPYLALLLLDRAFRDDARCQSKYGKYWEHYCKLVPYMVIPGIL